MSNLPFRGIIPPLVTPLLDHDRLDVDGFQRLIAHVAGGGVHGIFLLGTTGEGPSLGHRLQCEVITQGCHFADKRTPVLIGVTDTALAESLARSAARRTLRGGRRCARPAPLLP
ncbi:MAG: dihydrodipicolinate synthase family protein [Planctomycetaceae bacterium]